MSAAATSLASKGIKFTVGPAAFFSSASAPITNRNKMIDVLGYNILSPEQIGPNQPVCVCRSRRRGRAHSVGD